MAVCPECKAEIDQMAVECPECGWDFPSPEPQSSHLDGWAYSSFADAALEVGKIASLLTCVGCLIAAVASLFSLRLLAALISALGFVMSFANFVVFTRLNDRRKYGK